MEELKKIIKEKGISLYWISKNTQIPYMTVHNNFNDKTKISHKNFEKIKIAVMLY